MLGTHYCDEPPQFSQSIKRDLFGLFGRHKKGSSELGKTWYPEKNFNVNNARITLILGSLDLGKQPKNNLNSDVPGHLKERGKKGLRKWTKPLK